MPKPSHLHVFTTDTFIPTRTHYDPGTKTTQIQCTMLEDFPTEFVACLVMSDGTTYELGTDELTWTPMGKAVEPGKKPNILKGMGKGKALLKIKKKDEPQLDAVVHIEVMQSDLLVYAPDGKVYKVPGSVWRGDPSPAKKVEVLGWRNKELPDPIWNMLANEVTVANVPNVVRNLEPGTAHQPPAGQLEDPKTDNVTCFLLNLNSIALSYSPPQVKTGTVKKEPKSGGSGSSGSSSTAPSRRKR
ncbi:hypothetical protein [Archangium gephyra]|nr:hypothetical protein [Archangium gephyra]